MLKSFILPCSVIDISEQPAVSIITTSSVLQIEAAGWSKIFVPGSSQKTNLNILFSAARTYKSPVLKLSFWVSCMFDSLVFMTEHLTAHSRTIKLNVTSSLQVQRSNNSMDGHFCGFFHLIYSCKRCNNTLKFSIITCLPFRVHL